MCHYYGRFNDAPKKEYTEGEICFVDMINREDFKDDILNSIMQSLGYDMDDEVLFYYKIPLKSLDIGLKPLVSESDYRSFLWYVQKLKVMHVYVELVEKDKEQDSDSDSDRDSESENEIVDEEHVADEVEVNINNFKFQRDEEDEISGNDVIVPNVNVTEDNLEVLDFDSLESDLEDVPKDARSLGLRKLKKKHSSSKFFIGREFENRDLAKDLIRDHAVKIVDISGKDKLVNEDAEDDKSGCPWLLYLSKGDKEKWVIKTFKDEHKCLQSRKFKYCTSSFLSKGITNLIILNPQMPIKAIQEQMQKKFHVVVSKDKAFRVKAKAQVHLRGDVKYPRQMLTTVGVDANDGIYHIAYGIVESENQYSWTWSALAKLFPSAEHRYCVRYNNENMNQTWKGSEYKEMLWRCATSTTEVLFQKNMQHLKDFNKKAYEWLHKIPHEHWSRAYFSVIQKCDGPLNPAVAKLFDKIKAASTGCTVKWNGSELYQVKGIPKDWVHDYYKLQTWMNVYSHNVNPVNGRDMWSKYDCPTTLLPPKVHPQIRRPPKKIKKGK
uniref:MULE transposase domain-containing protein n=1 Tax=Tanacetum cinerariifolium TaxID=118510 RepID=A0A699GZD6_TANCI|nr:hypothetical protein [Tanacetum cinerariifolium]